MTTTHEFFMRKAIKEAHKALDADEVPIGAIVVMQDKIIARGYNQVETLTDSTAHAEIIALTSAFNYLGSKYLPEAILYVTIEPCVMCCGAMYWSKIGTVVYGSPDPKHGGLSLLTSVGKNKNALHPKTKIVSDVLPNECVMLIKDFFRKRR
ncbi:MAG: nucleoside deaminase [Ginsengibacter sp.]